MSHMDLIARLARPAESKVVLLILDGVGDLRTADQPQTALEAARTPNLDALAERSALGRIVPVAQGVTPGSGPGHLALFGYDPAAPEHDIGRGILEAYGLGLDVEAGQIAARGNFATVDAEGNLTDRRAGRIPSEEGHRLCDKIRPALDEIEGLSVAIEPGEAYRFVLIFSGSALSDDLADTDPQKLGVPPLAATARTAGAEPTARLIQAAIERIERAIADEPQANRVLLRGFSKPPSLARFTDLYQLRAGAFAGYPLYRGVARACGMEVVPCGKRFGDIVSVVSREWERFDYLFLHVKQTDQAGEDGDLATKAAVLEEVDAGLPDLLGLGPDVVAITGDHSTPAPMKAHSWHPVPLLLAGERCFVDGTTRFDEEAAARGHVGTVRSSELLGLMLANAGRLAKYGA